MKLPIAWLRDYLDVSLKSDEIAARFAALGFPVEAIDRRPAVSGVVIGRLARVEKHPNADTLSLCTVDVGTAQTLTIATAATNVREGDVVPVATIGAEVVGLSIGRRKMRGIDSEGMLCSAGELGLNPGWFEDGILQLEQDLPLGGDFVAYFRLADDVLDVEVTANRPDCLSIVGLARELSASLDAPLRLPAELDVPGEPAFRDVTLSSDDCKAFVAQRFSTVRVDTAPFWMRVRLALAGQRPIGNLVDISNFVMLEVGQPLHFYDFARMAGGAVVVRDARKGETMQTLDGAQRSLDERFLVIADAQEAQCIAGLMGAATSEVTSATRELLLEAATFSGPRIRRMSVALGLRTEASARHEKGLPVSLAAIGARRAAYLLTQAGATAAAPYVAGSLHAQPTAIDLAVAHIGATLGMAVASKQATRALTSLGFAVAGTAETLEVTAPPWRGDVHIAQDLIEEVGRIVGYDNIVAEMPPVLEQSVSSNAYRAERSVAHALASAGYREAVTFALQSQAPARAYDNAGVTRPSDAVEIINPLSEDQRYLRFSLLPALLELAAKYAGPEPYRVFEIGHVFASESAGQPFETAGVAWLFALPALEEPAWHDSGFLTFKAESLALLRELTGCNLQTVTATSNGWHPGKTARLLIEGRDVATIGAVDPRLARAFDAEGRVYAGWFRFADLPAPRVPRYQAASRYPTIARDLAVVVAPDLPAIDVEHAVRVATNGVLQDVRVFDEYRGPQIAAGKKSLAVRVVLGRLDATLTDADAQAYVRAIIASLRERCDAAVRE